MDVEAAVRWRELSQVEKEGLKSRAKDSTASAVDVSTMTSAEMEREGKSLLSLICSKVLCQIKIIFLIGCLI